MAEIKNLQLVPSKSKSSGKISWKIISIDSSEEFKSFLKKETAMKYIMTFDFAFHLIVRNKDYDIIYQIQRDENNEIRLISLSDKAEIKKEIKTYKFKAIKGVSNKVTYSFIYGSEHKDEISSESTKKLETTRTLGQDALKLWRKERDANIQRDINILNKKLMSIKTGSAKNLSREKTLHSKEVNQEHKKDKEVHLDQVKRLSKETKKQTKSIEKATSQEEGEVTGGLARKIRSLNKEFLGTKSKLVKERKSKHKIEEKRLKRFYEVNAKTEKDELEKLKNKKKDLDKNLAAFSAETKANLKKLHKQQEKDIKLLEEEFGRKSKELKSNSEKQKVDISKKQVQTIADLEKSIIEKKKEFKEFKEQKLKEFSEYTKRQNVKRDELDKKTQRELVQLERNLELSVAKYNKEIEKTEQLVEVNKLKYNKEAQVLLEKHKRNEIKFKTTRENKELTADFRPLELVAIYKTQEPIWVVRTLKKQMFVKHYQEFQTKEEALKHLMSLDFSYKVDVYDVGGNAIYNLSSSVDKQVRFITPLSTRKRDENIEEEMEFVRNKVFGRSKMNMYVNDPTKRNIAFATISSTILMIVVGILAFVI